MFPRRLIVGFLVRLTIAYLALLAVYPLIRAPYIGSTCFTWNMLFCRFVRETSIRFEQIPNDKRTDMRMVLTQRGGEWQSTLPTNTQRLSYVPSIVLFSLVLASPFPWRRRLIALAWSVPIAFVLASLRAALLIIRLGIDSPLKVFEPNPFWRSAYSSFVEIMVWLPTGMYLVPVIAWILLMFRRGDVRMLLTSNRAAAAPGSRKTSP